MQSTTRAKAFDQKTKIQIAERDSFDGWPCCINCGKPAPNFTAWSNAHYIGRAQMGLGIPENGLTLCPECHRRYDQTTERPKLREHFREYLQNHYPDWDESKLYYRRELENA